MPNILAALVLIAGVVALVLWLRRRRNRPERRLVRDFSRLRRLILAGMASGSRDEARRLLDDCQRHLEALLLARQQHQLLESMAGAASELTGHQAPGGEALADFDRQVAQQLGAFFASLSRISTVVGLQGDEALDGLRAFGEELELQRRALVELSAMLSTRTGPSGPSDDEASDPRANHVQAAQAHSRRSS